MPRKMREPTVQEVDLFITGKDNVFGVLPPIHHARGEMICLPYEKTSKQRKAGMARRLTEERNRLGYSQRDFAYQTEISRETLRRYEIAKRWVGVDFLARAAFLGLDVNLVVTGVSHA